jgi:hypothetical protein
MCVSETIGSPQKYQVHGAVECDEMTKEDHEVKITTLGSKRVGAKCERVTCQNP